MPWTPGIDLVERFKALSVRDSSRNVHDNGRMVSDFQNQNVATMPIRHVLFLRVHPTHINGVMRFSPGARKYHLASHVADLAKIRRRSLARATGKERRAAPRCVLLLVLG